MPHLEKEYVGAAGRWGRLQPPPTTIDAYHHSYHSPATSRLCSHMGSRCLGRHGQGMAACPSLASRRSGSVRVASVRAWLPRPIWSLGAQICLAGRRRKQGLGPSAASVWPDKAAIAHCQGGMFGRARLGDIRSSP